MKIYKSLIAIMMGTGLIQSVQGSPWPTAVQDSVTVNAGQRVYIPVLENDVGESLSLDEVNEATVKLGSVEVDAQNKVIYYTPAPGFTGSDSFWYAIKDNLGRTNSAQVSVSVISFGSDNTNVTDANTGGSSTDSGHDDFVGWPVANVDTVITAKNRSLTVAVLENDIGDRLSLSEVNDWTVKGGRAAIEGDSILYRPKADYVGQDSFWYNFVDARGRKNSTQVKITVTDDDGEVSPVVADVVPIPMHVDFLKSQRFVWGEPSDSPSTTARSAAPAGSSQLKVKSGLALKDNQLITYRSTDDQYYTVATGQSQRGIINLRTALPAPIAQNGKVWTFYRDGSHPNIIGFSSLIDFALRNADLSALNAGKHVMLGDSWFSSPGAQERLSKRLDNANIINKGVGGDTSAMLLQRFDSDVASENPDVVWLIAGTNDYYRNVSVEEYVANMKQLIEKIDALGAKAMVFDSSVAPSMSGSDVLTEKSHQYAKALADLLNQ